MAYTSAKRVMQANLILIDLQGLDIIFRMDFLAANYASMNCLCKEITFKIPRLLETVFHDDQRVSQAGLISAFVTHWLLRKECMRYLTHIVDTRVEEVRLEDFPVV